jgi:RecQ family ATP-dependent DNA helicase
MLWTDKANKILLKYFNNITLKDKQIDIINELLKGNDVIGLLPTGYGKSMCYIIPALVTKKAIFIISPLISLMEDQKDNLTKKNIKASTLHCNNKYKSEEILQILNGEIKIIFMSPEFFVDGEGLLLATNLNKKNMLGYFAVDESHCISNWGHNFRPNYLKLKLFREEFEHIPIVALTATAKKTVITEIKNLLNLNKPILVSTSFDRPNLHISCNEIPKEPKRTSKGSICKKKGAIIMSGIDKWIIVKDYIIKYPNDKIIIYINSRNETEQLSNDINNNLYNCSLPYHAGLSKDIREETQNNFNENKIKVIISTIAFGMGIDQIVRCVLIFGCPTSIEEYYQQIGRGGRDGLYCETVLYYDRSGFYKSKMLLNKNSNNPQVYQLKLKDLEKVAEFYNYEYCRRKFILNYFGQDIKYKCNNCDNCLKKKVHTVTDEIEEDIFEKYSKY